MTQSSQFQFMVFKISIMKISVWHAAEKQQQYLNLKFYTL